MAFAFGTGANPGVAYGTAPAMKAVKSCAITGIPAQTFTITTAVSLLDGTNQDILNMIVETVAANGQPIGITLPTTGGKVMTIVLEHAGAWTAAALDTALEAAFAAGGGTGGAEFTVA